MIPAVPDRVVFHPPRSLPRAENATPSTGGFVHELALARTQGPRSASAAQRLALAENIRHASLAAGVEPALSVAVAHAESSLNPAARSTDGLSHGSFQVTRTTAAEMKRKFAKGTAERPPGPDDVALGVGYLRYLHDLFGRRAKLTRDLQTQPIQDERERELFAVAAFNAGEGRVARAQARARAAGRDPTQFASIRAFLPGTTQGYVDRVTRYTRETRGTWLAQV